MSKQNTLIAVAAFLVAGISGSYTALVNGTAAVEPTQTMEKTEFASTDPGFKPMFTEDSFVQPLASVTVTPIVPS